jgi:predicted lipoprotein with Yx(FWY)xxD motif
MSKIFENQTVQDTYDIAYMRGQRVVKKRYFPLVLLSAIMFLVMCCCFLVIGIMDNSAPTSITYTSLDGNVITFDKGVAIYNDETYIRDVKTKNIGQKINDMLPLLFAVILMMPIGIYVFMLDKKPGQMAWDVVKELPNVKQE